jgi:hypothetical protein
MVWCARESADFKPGESDAMQLFEPYGWIHWGGTTWHTVTGYELGKPLEPVIKSQAPISPAYAVRNPAFTHADGADLANLGHAGDPQVDAAAVLAIQLPAVQLAAAELAAAQAPLAGQVPPAAGQGPPLAGQVPPAVGQGPPLAGQVPPAAGQVPVPQPPVQQAPSQQPPPAQPPPAQPPLAEAAPTHVAPSSEDPSAWDSDHKRDGDRADAEQALYNTRWDTQHTLDNARWDTRHTLDNSRWDAQHTLDNARWDTRHTLENARWDTYLALKRAREDAALAADMALLQAVHGSYLAVAQSSLDRAIQRATYVATAAGAIGTLYTAVLAARYTTSHEAPARSIVPALFIGAAVAFSVWYMAFLRGHTRNQQLLLSGTGGSVAETRLLDFMEWSFSGVLARAWSLRVSVISLALGLALLPIGLVQLSSGSTDLIGFAALAILVLWLIGELIVALWPRELNNSRPSKTPRLAPKAPDLPAAPTAGFDPTGPRAYGLDADPPDPPQRAADVNPPAAPDAAAWLPPDPPQRAADVNPPAPPDTAGQPEPPAPLLGPLAPSPRPTPTQQASSPTELKVDLRLGVDRPGRHP